ncbi:cation diffusion facilitator CzcD-associated flavoprotein CzcO [Sphingobium sp. OAS761]|uniref:flavin-containing monooxygenase n=1 Tax=Sphingobium sp. OAS761 TaxID=2817901 RepID=UPI00209DCAB1|nr:NAD(P)/FAD-dependent oxidoreductase [Sphingobium sp. OAS761]MCP1471465.1 cation diffusion facilitator CzcD-associated flavoprotein CzcO [Sphingobium sp. OAS761]
MADVEPLGRMSASPDVEAAIAILDPAVALAALIQITGDRTLLHRYGPALEGTHATHKSAFRAIDGEEALEDTDQSVAQELRTRLAAEVGRDREPVLPKLDRPLFRELVKLVIGSDLPDMSVEPAYQHAGFTTDTRIRTPERLPPADFKVLIVGAGMVGINAAIKLQQAGFPYQIVEANSDVGGTWLVNTYPGAAVDTESRIYSYSFEPNSSWTRYYANGPEFLTYLNKVVDKYGVRDRVDFNTRVAGAEWDEDRSTWTLKATRDGQEVTYEGNVLIMATGPNNGPKYPDVGNMDAFGGRIIHTAQWDDDLDLAGKKVVLVGAACSGVQVAAAVADQVSELAIVMRQPEYLIPNANARAGIDPLEIIAMENIPFVAQWKRMQTLASQMTDMRGMIMIDPEHREKTGGIAPLNDGIRDMCRNHIQQQFPDDPDMVKLLTPDYPVFAKRPILDCSFYDTIKKPNVDLVKGALASFDESAVILADGQRIECDIVVLATGYNMYWGTQFEIKGRDGKTLRDIFDPAPFTYWGMMVPGLPNFVLPAGPYSNLVANHAVLGEQHIHYVIELLQTMVDEQLATFEVTQAAADRFVEEADRRLAQTAWVNKGTAHGYYRHPSGKVVLAIPYHNSVIWHKLRQPEMADYQVTKRPDATPEQEREPEMLEI